MAEIETGRIVEMIDLRYCTLSPYEGPIIEVSTDESCKFIAVDLVPLRSANVYPFFIVCCFQLHVKQKRLPKMTPETRVDDDDDYQVTFIAIKEKK